MNVHCERGVFLREFSNSGLPLTGRSMASVSDSLSWDRAKLHYNFPRGVRDVLEFYFDAINQSFDETAQHRLQGHSLSANISEYLFNHLLCHFECGTKSFDEKLLSRYFFPRASFIGYKLVFDVADKIWVSCQGVPDANWSYYSKRGIVVGIYIASWSYVVNDGSSGYCDTRLFVEKLVRYPVMLKKIQSMLG